MNGEHKVCYKLVLLARSADRVMESGSKIVSANVSTEPSCELAASSFQNSLPGDSFMEVNTDMKKALRGGYTCVPGCYSKKRHGTLFSQVS